MNRMKSLNITMVFLVFCIMVSAGLLTAFSFVFLYSLGIFPIPALTPILMPLIALFVCSVIGTFISAVASEILLKPLNQLIKATKAVSTGDFTVRVEEMQSDSEIAELLRNFNHMTEELGSIEMFRNDFINDFSHEFKTPIVSIRGFAKQLQNDALSPDKRKEYADIIVSESERLANMSTNILLLTKFENQQLVTNQIDYDLDEQIRNCIILLEKQWSTKNLELNLDMEVTKICADPEMLSHLWINLIENAIKYSDENSCISISCHAMSEYVQFQIKNGGSGMDEDTLRHIFDKFYQVDKSRAARGSGIGLSIVKRIVELCKGEIAVESKIGQGTTFTVKIPKVQA